MDTRKAAMKVGAICIKVALFVAIVLGIVCLGQASYRYSRAVFSNAAFEEAPGKAVKLTISQAVDAKELAKVLEENGVIEDAVVFQIQMKMAGFDESVEAGTYEVNTSMPPSELFEILSGINGEDET